MSTTEGRDLHELIEEFQADTGSLSRFYPISASARRRERFDRLYQDWQDRLESVEFDGLSHSGQVDYVLFRNHLAYRRRQLEIDAEVQQELRKLVPFADAIIDLDEARMRMEPLDPEPAAKQVHDLASQFEEAGRNLEESGDASVFGHRSLELVKELQKAFDRWFDHYDGYDPSFSWWLKAPFLEAKKGLRAFAKTLEAKTVGSDDTIVGYAVGRDALLADLAFEMVPYTPEQLIALGEREYAWCEAEMKKASNELGFGDDWHAALEFVKEKRLAPGKQPELVRNLALEAIEYVEQRDLLTVPELAKETWRMEMMSAERQLTSPFFLGGETIIVSYPTQSMSHARKLMSMRGNNPHFSRATVQHELIPGHHIQQFMTRRYRPYRRVFNTPFWVEGWTLYWELLLWDLGFPGTAENRIGMLFWRMHRCVRIVFSLRFHLGEMTPQECVDMLVERVGHERANAEGEVRRSFNGSYPPLYQAAYMIGGLQVKALRKEVVDSGKMTDREFHDTFMKENEMPIAVLRAVMLQEPLQKEATPVWKFEGEPLAP